VSAERVQKILARAGIAARRKAEELIREGRVTINGQVAEIGGKADPEQDTIKVDGKRVVIARTHRYLLMNKPKGVLTAVTDDSGRTTVLDLVPPPMRTALVPVGRLDFHTEGLIVLTDDGELAQRLSHPRYGCHKTYEVKVSGAPEAEKLDRLRRGVLIDGRRTAPCRIAPLRTTPVKGEEGGNAWFRVELAEGRSRQIREMFFRIGHPVQKLRRVAIGPVSDPQMPVGSLRDLSEAELDALRRITSSEKPARIAPPPRRPRPRPETAAGRAGAHDHGGDDAREERGGRGGGGRFEREAGGKPRRRGTRPRRPER
jgi:23S rRNA pseudouridine2605 synthase